MQIHLEVFVNRQTDKQANDDYIILGGGKNAKKRDSH